MQVKNFDIVIIGGGLVGASLLLALKDSGLSCALIESKQMQVDASPELDQRSLVLSLGSKLYYEQLGIWPSIAQNTTKIDIIKISEQYRFSKLFLDKHSFGVDALGYIINIQLLHNALWSAINSSNHKKDNIHILCPAKLVDIDRGNAHYTKLIIEQAVHESSAQQEVRAKIVIAADGGRSFVRELLGLKAESHNYNQLALIANVEHEFENNSVAYERFSEQGPFALLPRENKKISGIVWPWPIEQAEYIKNLSDDEILHKLQKLFGYKLGTFYKIGKRQFFPLWRIVSKELFKDRIILLGNSANNIHPIGGQGFNLGLRDVKHFSQVFLSYKQDFLDTNFERNKVEEFYSAYQNTRIDDHYNLINNTHRILSIYNDDAILTKIIRNLGTTVINHSLVLRTFIADHSMGLRI